VVSFDAASKTWISPRNGSWYAKYMVKQITGCQLGYGISIPMAGALNMRPKVSFFLGLVATIVLLSSADAEVLAVCGPSRGTGYYLMTSAIPPKDAGWREEKEEPGSFQLVYTGTDFDIFFTDTIGTRSAKADGATVFSGGSNNQFGILNILAMWSNTGVLESYLFKTWSTHLLRR
jgi:hypothetical protein